MHYPWSIFEAEERNELIDIITQAAYSIPPDILNPVNRPLIICISGDRNAGKSLIWDTLRSCFVKAAQKLKNFSHESDDYPDEKVHRNYECWLGQGAHSGQLVKFFCANARNLPTKMEKAIKSMANGTPECLNIFGNIIVLSNLEALDTNIPVDLHFDLHFTDDQNQKEWSRSLTVSIPQASKLKNERQVTRFLMP